MAPVVEKAEIKTSTEVVDPLKQALVIVEHKIRNLEKRKKKIEIYQEDQRKGQTLNNDQQTALKNYVEVVKSLELAQDLKKQFEAIHSENNKQQKKQAKKEAYEKSLQEVARVKEILLVQDVLQSMGLEEVREDFLAGTNSAIRITEQELGYLDTIYDEIFPKRIPEEPVEKPHSFDEQLTLATEHLVAIVDGKPKEVVGTTYKQLKELITRISECGYLDKLPTEQGLETEMNGTADIESADVKQKKESFNEDNKLTQTEKTNGWS